MEETQILREWTPMTEIVNQIPVKTQMGLFAKYISITCIDAVPEFIAFGTNVGLLFWYNRKVNQLERFKCETNAEITCIGIVSTVDFMIACGHEDGQISIFQIPKLYPELLPDSLKSECTTRKSERYTVTEIHSSPISSLEWTTNGMKLFSGDKNGLVVLTELDFSMHICKEVEIVNESYEIVQLSYSNQYLLISTMYRSIICERIGRTWKVCQVGKKDRKNLGKFGGILVKTGLKPKDLAAYCSRPGLRIWKADISGAVERTILFKDLITSDTPEIPLINPISDNFKQFKNIDPNELSFGRLLYFNNKYLVSYESNVIYILDADNLAVVGAVTRIRRVLDVACNKDELFILEGERSLLRIAFEPETIDETQLIETNPPEATIFLPLSNSIKDITSKFQATNILAAVPSLFETNPTITECSLETNDVIHAEEALESPQKPPDPYSFNSKNYVDKIVTNGQQFAHIVASLINTNDPIQIDKNLYVSKFESPRHIVEKTDSEECLRKLDMYEKIGEEDFDSILFKPEKRKPHKRHGNIMTNSYPMPDSPKLQPLNCSMIEPLIKPDLRSPDSIQNDIKTKELLLSDVLYYKTVIENNSSDDNMEENKVDEKLMAEEEKMLVSIPNTNGTFKSKLKKLEMPVWVQDERSDPIPSSSNGISFIKRIKKKALPKNHGKSNGYSKRNFTDAYNTSYNPDDYLGHTPNFGSASNDLTDGSDVSLTDWEILSMDSETENHFK